MHRIPSVGDGRGPGDILGLYVGDYLCSLHDIEPRVVSPTSPSFITCALPPNIEGGYYTVKPWMRPGYAKNAYKMKYASLTNPGQIFELIVNPSVTAVSMHSGAVGGNKITITGTGFSADSTKLNIKAAGLNCLIISSTAN